MKTIEDVIIAAFKKGHEFGKAGISIDAAISSLMRHINAHNRRKNNEK